jgi:hypothetical protein
MNKLLIKEEFGQEAKNLSAEAMAIVIDQLKHGKGNKNFNCFVLEKNELMEFLIKLEKSKNSILDDTRFQLLFKDVLTTPKLLVDHWSTIDVSIKSGKIEFILVDAANCLPTLFYLFTTIHSCCPNALISQLSIMIQADDDNCAYFALTHAWSLSKITDLHSQAAKCKKENVGEYNSYMDYANSVIKDTPFLIERLNQKNLMASLEKINYIPMGEEIPKNFGSLFKNTQLVSAFFNTFDPSYLIRSNGQTVSGYIQKHSERDRSNPYRLHVQNRAIQYKMDKIKNRTLLYLQSLSEEKCEAIISERQGYASNLFKPQFSSVTESEIRKRPFFYTIPNENKSEVTSEKIEDMFAFKINMSQMS